MGDMKLWELIEGLKQGLARMGGGGFGVVGDQARRNAIQQQDEMHSVTGHNSEW